MKKLLIILLSLPFIVFGQSTNTIWMNDFSDASEWTMVDLINGGLQNWVITTNGPTGFYSSNMGVINSTTAANGFALFDSDALNTQYSPQEATITYNGSIDCSNYQKVKINFECYHRVFHDSVFVEISTDNFATVSGRYRIHPEIATNDSSSNPELVSLNISSSAGNQPNVYLRFHYEGEWDYAIMIDDVSLEQIFYEDFESYNLGDPIAETSPNWNTWGELISGFSPPFTDDAYVTDLFANSGSFSLGFNTNPFAAGPEDIVLPLSNIGYSTPFNTGTFTLSQNLYVSSGAYFNFQAENTPGISWALDVTFDDATGTVNYASSGSSQSYLYTSYPQNQWFELKMVIDLTNNNWEVFHDGILQGSFSSNVNQIASLDYYPTSGQEFFVDDVCLDYTPLQLDPLNLQALYVEDIVGLSGQTKFPEVEVRNLGVNTINSFDVTYDYNGIQLTENISGLNLTSMSTYNVNFSFPITLSSISNATVYVHNINGGQLQSTNDDTLLANLNIVVPASGKLVIGEIATGTWSGWDPRGIVADNWMHQDYEGYWQGIAVHNSDPMEDAIYDNGIVGYISGYPSGLVDRGSNIDPIQFEQDFLQRIVIPPHVQIQNNAVRNNNILSVNVCLDFVNNINGNLKVACILVEDSVTGSGPGYYQSNFYSGGSSLIDVDGTDWANLPSNVPDYMMIYRNVARAIAPSFGGDPLPSNSYANGQSYSKTFDFAIDPSWDVNNLKIVSILIDDNGQIDNAGATKYNDALNNSFACSIYGCTDPNALNYDPLATVDNGSCNLPVYGCNSNTNFEIPTTDIQIGTTTYDLQSNAAVDNRLIRHSDGTISATWTMSSQFSSSYSDRGTGYNYYDGSSWAPDPTSRIESSRTGWPSILTTGFGKEIVISHNTDYNYMQMSHRPSKGNGPWTEQIISSFNLNGSGVYTPLTWNRAVVGGVNNQSVHMIGVIAPTGLGGSIYNGLDGALVYYRSLDGGNTWDIQDMQLPTLDSTKYLGFDGDNYAIEAKGDTIVVAYFGDWDDSVILKSIDNGNSWTPTVFLDFPVDKYVTDSGLDLDGDGIMDTVYTTDSYGSLLLDNNGSAHVFFGNMRVLDADLSDAGTSYFGGTNGLMYWNENMGTDVYANNPIVNPSLWYSSKPKMIAYSQDLDGDGVLNFVDYPIYYSSITSMPSSGIDSSGNIYVSYSSLMENIDNGSQNFRHINLITSSDGGTNWSCPIDLTPWDSWGGAQECVFARMDRNVDDKVRLLYQKDFEPGLAVRGDVDIIDMNYIQYLECNVVDVLKEGCTDLYALNFDSTAIVDNGTCLYSLSCGSDLFFSEYVESAGNNKALEIYNPTSQPIDLSQYNIERYPNGYVISPDVLNLSGTINPNDVVVITNGQTDTTYSGGYMYLPCDPYLYSLGDLHCSGIYPTPLYFNGDDALVLSKNGIPIDVFGRVGEDPGSAWTDDAGAGFTDANGGAWWTREKTLIRKSTINSGDNDGLNPFNPSLEWDSLPDGTYSNLGFHNNDCYNLLYGCMDSLAINYDNNALVDDGSCIYCDISTQIVTTNPSDSIACDGIIIINTTSSYPINSYSIIDQFGVVVSANNFSLGLCSGLYTVIVDDSIGCLSTDTIILGTIYGCMDSSATNYNPYAMVDDGSCSYPTIFGCTDSTAINYFSGANTDDGSCIYCDLTNTMVVSQNSPGNCDGYILANSSSSYGPISYLWSTGSTQNNILSLCDGIYTVIITDNIGCSIEDTIVMGTIFGCTDPLALNFDPFANTDDGSCLYCDLTNTMIVTQNTTGNCDGFIIANSSSSNGPITYLWSTGSTQNNLINLCAGTYSVVITDNVGCTIEDTIYIGLIPGCTDPTAMNYDPLATIDDGSCTYSSNCTSPKPTGLFAFDVIDTRAKVSWDNMNDANCMVWKYFVRYREVGTSGWTTKSAGVGNGLCNFGLNTVTKQLLNLTPSTTYEFRMKAFYCGGTSSNYSTPVQFTTADPCPDMTNLTTTTFNANQSKVRFNWDTTGAYTFARILLRVDIPGSNWQTAGGFGVYYPTLFVNKFGLTPGQAYRAQGRTFCDSNITAYRSPTWTAPVFWSQPGSIKLEGGTAINNLDVYPNPSRDVFNISFNSDIQQDLTIRILNVVGGEVYREDRQQFIGEYIKQISLDNYGKGIYFLEIQTTEGIINKKLILQ